jgi:phosphocarrier protein FPr
VAALADTDDARQIVRALAEAEAPAAAGVTASEPGDLSVEARVGAAHGLHARPATIFVEAASRFESRITIRWGSKTADGKSMVSLLQLGAPHGAAVRIFAGGPDAAAALVSLKAEMERTEEEERPSAAASHGWTPRGETVSLAGISASPGLAIGRIRLLVPRHISADRETGDPAGEKRRLREAIALAGAQLDELHEQVRLKTGAGAAAIFRSHREFLNDPELLRVAVERIDAGESAAWAWQQRIDEQAAALEKVDNPLLAARSVDLRDVGARVRRNLEGEAGGGAPEANSDDPILLLAQELTPSETATLDPLRIAGFCTAAGGPTSHAAIIARALNIPAVVGAGAEVLRQQEGITAILDADRGVLYLNPEEANVVSAREAQQRLKEARAGEYERRFEPAITMDGTRVEVCANIGRAEEAAQAVEGGGEGVGLMRSEFLFLHREAPPPEEEQYEAYRRMVEALGGLPLILRTLDIGGDKSAPYIAVPREENPFLGVRGIRLCLRNPELFRPQLRAAYRASVHGSLKLMFPMIATVAELRAARKMAEEVRGELGVPPVEIGTMIEVPSAVVMAPELAREVDFFSVGTNDLTQYVLAMDRGNALLSAQADALHPAVLRLIEQTVKAAANEGKWVGVCGGLAGDPLGAVILMGLGVKELSMPIPALVGIKARIRAVSMAGARSLAQRALACEDADAVRRLAGEAGCR